MFKNVLGLERFRPLGGGWPGTFSHGVELLPVSMRRFRSMNGIIYLIGLIVVIMAILSLVGLR